MTSTIHALVLIDCNDPAVKSGTGEPITFEWELPWADFKHRMDIKTYTYIAFDTQGKRRSQCEAYVDNLITDKVSNAHAVDGLRWW